MNVRLIAAIRPVVLSLLLTGLLIPPGASWSAAAQGRTVTWTVIDSPGPAARWDHTLAADPTTRSLILFGGRDPAGAPLGDSWIYGIEENSWVPLEGPAPSPRFGHAVAIDAGNRALYLFGGQADGDTFFNDTWRFDLDARSWSEIPTGDLRPSPRYGTSAVFDGEGKLLVSHGFTFEGRFDDTWSLDPESGIWTDISPAPDARPLKRCLHEAVWDAGRHRMVLYGGCSSGFGPCPQGDLWVFDPATRTWTDLTPSGSPAARSNPALVRDDANGVIRLIDGLTEAGYTADLWTLDLTGEAPAWVETAQGSLVPEPRASHDATVLDGQIYLFGGTSNVGPRDDFWVLAEREEGS